MNRRLFFFSITSALSGFLFGFDTVVISGAERTIQELWELGNAQHGLAMSMALWGTVAGAMVGGWASDLFGRRKTLLWIGAFYLISALASAFAPEVYSFMAARFLGGIAVGISTVAAPMYISEIAPAAYRGRLTGLFQFNIVFGILVAFFSNAMLAGVGENAWRWMLGVEAVPALLYSVFCLAIPESPRWLILKKGDLAGAIRVLGMVHPEATPEVLEAKAAEIASTSAPTDEKARFWTRRLRVPILLAFLIAFFNQLSGINAILYFSPRVFALTGLGEQAALLQSIGIGVTNLAFTFVGLWLIDRVGRRTLLLVGSFGYIASLGIAAWAFYTGNLGIVPICIFAFIASHAVGQGAVIWVFISEIFPNRDRGTGQALGCSTHWIFAALLTMAFPAMVTAFHPGTVFLFFCGMMVLQLLWVILMVPETKGVVLEDVDKKVGTVN